MTNEHAPDAAPSSNDEITMVRLDAPTAARGWLEMLTELIGDPEEAAVAYANVLAAIESDDELSNIWSADEQAA